MLPDVWSGFSIITKENIYSAAHNVYTDIAAGTNIANPHPTSSVVINGVAYYVDPTPSTSGPWHANGGKIPINALSDIGINFAHFEWLAQNLKDSTDVDGKKVIVLTSATPPGGGCWNLFHFRDQDAQGEDNGITLVVFNTPDEICLTGTSSGRQFGPSVLAPFSKVVLRKGAGFLDGTIVARKFSTVRVWGDFGDNLQVHGDAYDGQVKCV